MQCYVTDASSFSSYIRILAIIFCSFSANSWLVGLKVTQSWLVSEHELAYSYDTKWIIGPTHAWTLVDVLHSVKNCIWSTYGATCQKINEGIGNGLCGAYRIFQWSATRPSQFYWALKQPSGRQRRSTQLEGGSTTSVSILQGRLMQNRVAIIIYRCSGSHAAAECRHKHAECYFCGTYSLSLPSED